MNNQIGYLLDEAKSFLRRYANAKTANTVEHESDSTLYTALSADFRLKSDPSQPLRAVVDYCTTVLEKIRDSLSNATESKYELGSVDLKAIDFLIEVIVHATTCPILTNGLKPPMRDVLSSSETNSVMSPGDIEKAYRRILPFLKEKAAPFTPFKKPGLLALLIAGAVELTFHPGVTLQSQSLYQELIKSIAAPKLLPSIQLLLTRNCPRWALVVLTKEMTQVLLRPKGLIIIIAFILQPDAKGEVPVERFDRLAGLVSAKPSNLSESAYMEILAPQIVDILDDNSSTSQFQRRAAAIILRKLCSVYKESRVIIERLWQPLLTLSLNSGDQKDCLERLSRLTAFEYLRIPVLSGYIPQIFMLGFHFDQSRAMASRDQVERLLYRLVEQDPCSSMVPGINALLDTSVISSQIASELQHDHDIDGTHVLESKVKYILKLVGQLAMDGKPLLQLQSDLISSYASGDPRYARAQQLELMIEIPNQNHKLFFVPNQAPHWASQARQFFNQFAQYTSVHAHAHELAVVYLNILKLMADEDVNLDGAHLSLLDSLVQTLRTVSQLPGSDLSEIVSAVLQKFELMTLTLQSSVHLETRMEATGSSRSKDEVVKKYAAAIQDMSSDMVPIRAHGLYMIGELAKSGTDMEEMHMNELLPVILGLLGEEEAYVHQNGIKALRKLVDAYGESLRSLILQTRDANRYSRVIVERIDVALSPATTDV